MISLEHWRVPVCKRFEEEEGPMRSHVVVRLLAALAALLAMMVAVPAAAACTLGKGGQTVRVAIPDSGRVVLLHVPAGADGRRLPLVLLFHGSGGSAAEILKTSHLEATADRYGFVLAAADAGIRANDGFAWNIPGVPTVTGHVPTKDDPDDVAFVGTVIDWLVAQGCADPARVYATGLSGGGRMTSWLGCVAAERFAAIAPVVGLRAGNPLAANRRLPDPATCTPSRPVPVLAFAGDQDTTNPIEGGGSPYWQYPMSAALARWAALDGCHGKPVSTALTNGRTELRYENCRAGAEVVGDILRGAGHTWTADNQAMWAFFARHRR
jgi:polyhydroxybutyrate depolymerase